MWDMAVSIGTATHCDNGNLLSADLFSNNNPISRTNNGSSLRGNRSLHIHRWSRSSTARPIERKEEGVNLVTDVTAAVHDPATLPAHADVREVLDRDGQALGAAQRRQVSRALDQGVDRDERRELALAFPEPCIVGVHSLRLYLVHQGT